MDTVLPNPQWPLALSDFVTQCLMWDPKNRPTSFQAMNHEYFVDAVDPLTRPRSSTTRLLGRKQSYEPKHAKEQGEAPSLTTRPSWFRKSLIGRESAPAIPQLSNPQLMSPRPSPVHHSNTNPVTGVSPKLRPNASKRATWSNGPTVSHTAPMPILPSIRPVSPLSNAVTAQARSTTFLDNHKKPIGQETPTPEKKKIGRQLSLASHGNHYGELHRGDMGGLASPTNGQKESFFSHLRKRARRLSGRNQAPHTPKYDDIEANAGCGPWASNRSSMLVDPAITEPAVKNEITELDKALQNVRYSLDASSQSGAPHNNQPQHHHHPITSSNVVMAANAPRRGSSLVNARSARSGDEPQSGAAAAPVASRARRALYLSSNPAQRYETPDEEEELLDEALHGVQRVVGGTDKARKAEENNCMVLTSKDINRQTLQQSLSVGSITNPYPTPSPSAKRNGVLFTNGLLDQPATPINISRQRRKEENPQPTWPTPPYEENEWAASAAASIFAAGSIYR